MGRPYQYGDLLHRYGTKIGTMSFANYLGVTARTLKSDVLPFIDDPAAAEAASNCLRVIAMLAAIMDGVEQPAQIEPPNDPDIRRLLAATVPPEDDDGLRIPVAHPSEDVAGSTAWGWAVRKAATRLREDSTLPAEAIGEMLRWEADLRGATLLAGERIQETRGHARRGGELTIDHEALQAYLRRRTGVPELAIVRFRQLLGGRSRQTALVGVAPSGALPAEFVCQRQRGVTIEGIGSVEGQFRLLRELHSAGLQVPRPILCELDPTHIDGAFMLVEKMPGATIIDAANGYFLPPPRWPGLALDIATFMGRLHSLDPATAERAVGRPLDSAGMADARGSITALRARWDGLSHARSIAVEAAFRWLESNVDCVDDRIAIVHTDMLLHNILAEGRSLSAVLDWELSHVGHPAEDLGYVRPVIEVMTDWPSFMAAYVAAGGQPVEQRQVDFFTLRALLQLGTLAQGARQVFESGAVDDIRLAEVGASFLPRLLDRLATVVAAIFANERTAPTMEDQAR